MSVAAHPEAAGPPRHLKVSGRQPDLRLRAVRGPGLRRRVGRDRVVVRAARLPVVRLRRDEPVDDPALAPSQPASGSTASSAATPGSTGAEPIYVVTPRRDRRVHLSRPCERDHGND